RDSAFRRAGGTADADVHGRQLDRSRARAVGAFLYIRQMSATTGTKRGKTPQSVQRADHSAPSTFLPARALSYALAFFLTSTLFFLREPIAAKRLVPLLGGSAAVWTTCLVFFQTALLLGYFVPRLRVTRRNRRTQVTAYVALLALSVVQLVRVVDPALQANIERPIASVLSF